MWAYLQANGGSPFSSSDKTNAQFAVPADKRMFNRMFDANVQENDRKGVIAAIVAIAVVVLILWLFVFLMRP